MLLLDRLKKVREGAELSQQELADKLCIPVRTYRSYEQGDRDVNTETLKKICEILDVSSDYLLGRSEDIKTQNFKTIAAKTVIIKNEPAPEGDRRLKEAEKMSNAELMRHLGVMLRELEKRYQSSDSEKSSAGKSSKET